jgi:hypothetical protein
VCGGVEGRSAIVYLYIFLHSAAAYRQSSDSFTLLFSYHACQLGARRALVNHARENYFLRRALLGKHVVLEECSANAVLLVRAQRRPDDRCTPPCHLNVLITTQLLRGMLAYY